MCDIGTIIIGTIPRITALLPVESYIRGDIPLIQSYQPAIVLYKVSFFTEFIPYNNFEGELSYAFVLNSATLKFKKIYCEKTKCGSLSVIGKG